jgi:class 3 adenylate cyclase
MSAAFDTGNRTFIGSVVFVDIVGYSRKSVSDQITVKDRFTALLADSLKDIPADQRIILDTGDGAALSFIGDPEDALFVSMNMRDMLKADFEAHVDQQDDSLAATDSLLLRIGINLGPIKLVRDINGQPNIVGDGINVAQRIMSFARPGQIVCSRSYFDVVSVISEEYAKLFKYEGSRTDKHVREHEIYVVGESAAAFSQAKAGMEDRAAATNPRGRAAKNRAAALNKTLSSTGMHDAVSLPFFQNTKKLAFTAAILACVIAALVFALTRKKSAPPVDVANPVTASNPLTPTSATSTPASKTTSTDPGKDATPANTTAGTSVVTTPDAPKAEPASTGTEPSATPSIPPIPSTPTTTVGTTPIVNPPSGAVTAHVTAANGERKPTPNPKSDAAKTDAALAQRATLNFAIQPWGEILINGRGIGVSPPVKQHKLPPGKYKIEIRNSTFTPYISNIEVKAREEISVRHKFQ